VRADRTLVPRVGGSVPTSRLLQFNISLVNPPSDRHCLFAPCISKLEDLHLHNVFLLGINDYEGWTEMDFLSSLSFQLTISTDVVLVFFNHYSFYVHIHDSLSN